MPGTPAEIIEAADADHGLDAGGRFGPEHQRKVRARVFTEESDVAGVDPEFTRVAPHELNRRPKIIDGFAEPSQPAQPVVDGEPVVPSAREQFEKLAGERRPAAGVPTATVHDHDSRAIRAAPLHVGVHRHRLAVRVPVDDVALDSGHDVVAFGIADDNRQTLCCGVRSEGGQSQPGRGTDDRQRSHGGKGIARDIYVVNGVYSKRCM